VTILLLYLGVCLVCYGALLNSNSWDDGVDLTTPVVLLMIALIVPLGIAAMLTVRKSQEAWTWMKGLLQR
jgi:hypothetical protein